MNNSNLIVKKWTFEDTQRLELAESVLNCRIAIRSAKLFTTTFTEHAQLIAELGLIQDVYESLSGMNIDEIEAVIALECP
jgi:hypothetical protein